MNTPRAYFDSTVVPSGEVVVIGGTPTGEIYDPIANTWTPIAEYPQAPFQQAPTSLLPNGTILAPYESGPQTYVYDPSSNTWAPAATKLRNEESVDETLIKLPDNSLLSYDIFNSENTGTGTAQRYLPGSDSWVDSTGANPYPVLANNNLGPGLLLQDGRAFQIGAQGDITGENGNTALYTPSTNTWVAGPPLPGGGETDEGPTAELGNGHVILDHLLNLYDFDPSSNTFSPVSVPTPLAVRLHEVPSFQNRMLMLHTGQLLFSVNSTTLWIYTPSTGAAASVRPMVQSVTPTAMAHTP
jgi:hypothetical protein